MTTRLLNTALTQLQHPFFIKDAERIYRYINPKAADLAGLLPSDFLGHKDEEIFGEEIGKIYRQKDLAVLNGETVHPLDVFTDKKAISRTYFIIRQVILSEEHKQPIGILGLRVDISNYITDISQLLSSS